MFVEILLCTGMLLSTRKKNTSATLSKPHSKKLNSKTLLNKHTGAPCRMGKVYQFLGMTCGAVQSQMHPDLVQAAFKCDITYITGQELCFSYLRDNSALTSDSLVRLT